MGWFHCVGLYFTISFASYLGVHSQTATFVHTESSVFAESRTTVGLQCKVENLGDKSVVWTGKDGTLLTFQDRRIVDDPRFSIVRPDISSWNLRIRDVSTRDAGLYICFVNTSPVSSHNVNLTVLVPDPEFVDTDPRMSVESGQTARLTCDVRYIGDRTATWSKPSDEHPLTIGLFIYAPDTRLSLDHSVQDGGISSWDLIIRNVSVEDAGAYVCSVVTKRNRISRSILLHVTEVTSD